MTNCRYCKNSNATWIKNLQRTTYACRLGKDTRLVHCGGFEKEGEDKELDIYEGSVMDTWS